MAAVVTPSGGLGVCQEWIKWVPKPTVLGAGNSGKLANPHEWEDSNGEAFRTNHSASESGHAHFVR